MNILIGIFLLLHGLVHLWYFTLSQRLVKFQPEMGWTGESWLLSNILSDSTIRSLASVLFTLAAAAFLVSGIGVFFRTEWVRSVLVGSAVFSSAILILYWDGGMQMLVQKGLIGLLINIAILLVVLLQK